MKKVFFVASLVILFVSLLTGCANPLDSNETKGSAKQTMAVDSNGEGWIRSYFANNDENDTGIGIDNEELESTDNNEAMFGEATITDSEHEIVSVSAFNDDGYAWITISKKGEIHYALLNEWMEICCILPFPYDEVLQINPFELDFDGNGSTLVELENNEKYIINEKGEITYTLDTNVYDTISFGSKGCYLVSKTFSGYDDYGTDYGVINAYGEEKLPLMRMNSMRDVGSGVFAIGLYGDWLFYSAKTGVFFEVDDLKPTFLMENEGDLFFDGVARVDLGTGRMLDPVALVYGDTGETVVLDINTEYAFYDYGPISDGGFIYYSYSYEGNRGNVVSSIGFYDIETGVDSPIFYDPENIIYDSIRSSSNNLKFVDGYVALMLCGADGNTYYSIVNKTGETVYGPQKDISGIKNMGEGYFEIRMSDGAVKCINVGGGELQSAHLHISPFNKGYAVADYGENYIDVNGMDVIIEIPEE